MHITSVNVGEKQTVGQGKAARESGILKLPSQQPVRLTSRGLENDVVVNKKHHGGPDQAVYIYGEADYDWWAQELGRPLPPGTFGDNLTISGLESAAFAPGDRLHIGDCVLEVTAPRHPCPTLDAVMEDPNFSKRFRAAERPGVYCRVILEGTLSVGQEVRVEPYRGQRVTLLEMFRAHYDPRPGESYFRRVLSAPISIRAQQFEQERLDRLQG